LWPPSDADGGSQGGASKENGFVSTGQVELVPRRRATVVGAIAVVAAALALLAALDAAQASAAWLPKLHASGKKIRDAKGRQVLLRGVNDTSLTDQAQVNPSLPTVVPLTDSDYQAMQGYGFNVIRLGISWSRLEPERGQIDYAYIQQIANVVQRAADHGMYTVIDMHNAGWGKYPTSTPETKCPRGLRPSHGWHGAPKWATFSGKKTTCHDDKTNKRTPAVRAAWTKFWKNFKLRSWGRGARGIQQHLIFSWAALAKAFAHNSAIAGYDLLNEPDPGYIKHRQLSKRISSFDKKAIRAIRRAEKRARGFSHMIFFEPNLTWSQQGLVSHSPRPGFSHDRNLVYAPHLYGRDVHSTERPASGVRRDLKRQVRRITKLSNKYRVPWWIGEWSFSPFDFDAYRKLLAHIRIQDRRQLGSAWWQWKVACGAPQTFDGLNPKPTHRILGNINRVKCPKAIPVPNAPRWRAVIARAYPRSSPGHLTDLRARGRRMRLAGKSRCNRRFRHRKPKACKLVVWIPNSKRPKVRGKHLGHRQLRKQPGGWIATVNVKRNYELRTR
jgi:endoglycosylceramidase